MERRALPPAGGTGPGRGMGGGGTMIDSHSGGVFVVSPDRDPQGLKNPTNPTTPAETAGHEHCSTPKGVTE